MRCRQLISAVGITSIVVVAPACGQSRRAPAAAAADSSALRVAQVHLVLQCAPTSDLLQCDALVSDLLAPSDGSRDVTDVVRWTTSDAQAVVVERGRIRATRGATAVVTATWAEPPGTASASVMVTADTSRGITHQVYVLEGEVRTFPTADGVAGARVTLINGAGVALSATTASVAGGLGQFRFAPLEAGTYLLRAVHEGYRTTEETVVLPDDKPHTLTLLPEPKDKVLASVPAL